MIRQSLQILCLLGWLWSGAFAQTVADAAALNEARAFLNEGKAPAVLQRLQPLARPTEPAPAAQYDSLLGLAYYQTGVPQEAIKRLAPLLDQFKTDNAARREVLQALALSHYLLGHLAEAIPLLEQVTAWSTNNEFVYALGMAAIQTRQPDKARAAFGRMYNAASDSAAAHLLTAQMMIRVEFEEFAETELKQALAKDPKLPQANYLLGQIAIYKNRHDEGIALMQKELAVNPNNANTYYKLGDAYTRQLKWDEAIAVLQKSVWLNPFYSGPYILLGKSYLKKRELTNAEGMLKRAAATARRRFRCGRRGGVFDFIRLAFMECCAAIDRNAARVLSNGSAANFLARIHRRRPLLFAVLCAGTRLLTSAVRARIGLRDRDLLFAIGLVAARRKTDSRFSEFSGIARRRIVWRQAAQTRNRRNAGAIGLPVGRCGGTFRRRHFRAVARAVRRGRRNPSLSVMRNLR
jgi:tetratricopeptide (TPR) repeat protein